MSQSNQTKNPWQIVCPEMNITEAGVCVEQIPVRTMLSKCETPFYLYSKAGFTGALGSYQKALADYRHLICYSMKSNSNLAILDFMVNEAGSGLDVVSGGELKRAKQIGCPSGKIVFAGVGKQEWEIELALNEGILLFNCESTSEIERINNVATRLGKKASISLRLNPNITVSTHEYIATAGSENKFGIPLAELDVYISRIGEMASVELRGLQIHLGSQLFDTQPFFDAATVLREKIESLRAAGFKMDFINVGGGYGIAYEPSQGFFPVDAWVKGLAPLLDGLDVTVILEPGRSISGPSGIFATKVLYRKEGYGNHKIFYIVDGGMNDLIRPSLYSAYHYIVALRDGKMIWDGTESDEHKPADIVGPICESGDFLAKGRRLPELEPGDVLLLLSAGAYGSVMSSRYNTRGLPAELLVAGDRLSLIRQAESYEDMVRLETNREL